MIVAAGRGGRMGGDKALLIVDGQSLIERHVERLCEVGCEQICIVTHRKLAPGLAALLDTSLVRVLAADEPTQARSLAIGLRALDDLADDAHVIVTPVDLVPVRAETIERLLAVLAVAQAATPMLRGRGGHPVVMRRAALAGLLVADPPTLRDHLHALGAERVRVEVDDEHVLHDLDTPAQLMALTGGPPQFRK